MSGTNIWKTIDTQTSKRESAQLETQAQSQKTCESKLFYGSPPALPKPKLGCPVACGLTLPNTTLDWGSREAQSLFAVHVLLNYDLPPWSYPHQCVRSLQLSDKYSGMVSPARNVQRDHELMQPLGSNMFGWINLQCPTTNVLEMQIVVFECVHGEHVSNNKPARVDPWFMDAAEALRRTRDETTTKPRRNHSSFIDRTTKPPYFIK